MTYEEFERIGMSEGVPYALCKLAWEMKPWRDMPLFGREEPLRMAFRLMIEKLDGKPLDTLAFVSSFELQPVTLELAAKQMMERHGNDQR